MELNLRLARLANNEKHSFHMPGHKGVFPGASLCDTTELPGLDNLHQPRQVLCRAQQHVANIYGAKKSYFLVNGSSVGLMAAIAATVKTGDHILVSRQCHKSIVAGLIHSGAMPIWIEQEYSQGCWLPPAPEQVRRLLRTYPIRALVIANPDYYGLVPDIKQITDICHAANVTVIVDEAHGAHLAFGSRLGLPLSGVEAGCDIIVQSSHKTLPALTQAAWMHIMRADLEEDMQRVLNIFQTTSPSYLLLASLEFAAHYAHTQGARMLGRLRLLAQSLTLKGSELGVTYPIPSPRDWTKFTLRNRIGLTRLLDSQGIFPEMVQGDKVLFMLTMADAVHPWGVGALGSLLPQIRRLAPLAAREIEVPALPEQVCPPREAWLRKGTKVLIENSLGRISRQVIAPYPPGTMIVAPGQRLNREHIEYLQQLCFGKAEQKWIDVI